MPLTIGTKIGQYEITSRLGEGGMGVVFRAHDTKLGRDVAIKALPDHFAGDQDRLSRFQREAQFLASLNHPNIAAIYGVEESSETKALVLELVDGETLADKIARGPLTVEDALSIASAIARALEAAHESGVIHRDLKPANVKITPDGNVKVLDFGLAKATENPRDSSGLSNSPTLSMVATQAGIIFGTAAYMSPEQAKGKTVDKRTDIWAFGVVLFEMLTGKQLFFGETASETMALVRTKEPDWETLPANTPRRIRELLRRCLVKDVRNRLRDIGDARIALEETEPAANVIAVQPLWRRAVPLLLVALAFAGIGGAIALNLKPSAAPAIVSRFPFTLPEGQQFTGTGRQIVSISPDGAQFVYVANSRLYLKPMRELQSIYIQGTEITQGGVLNPVFSPDGRSIAFWSGSDQMLKRIAVSGGAPVTICKTEAPFGISWGPNNQIFIGQGPKGIMRVSANGGLPETIVTVKSDELAHGPQVLPGGGAVLFTLLRPGAATNTAERWDKGQIVVQSLESGERKTLIEGGRDARYLPTGHIIYALAGTLLAVPFDIKRLEVITGPVPLVEGVYTAGGITGTAHFSFSDSGSLVYVPQPAPALSGSQMAFVDRNGGVKTLDLPSARYTTGPKVSPNGRQLAFSINDGKEENVWVYELSGGSSMRRLTFGGGRDPVWSGDGERITYGSGGGISWQRADGTGTAEQLYKPEGANAVLGSWNSQNQTLAFGTIRNNERDVWTYSLQDKNAAPLIAIRSSAQNNAFFSPDGRWIAYQSNETGSFEVYVQPFPNTGAKFQITRDGGGHPLWSPDGKELFYERAGRLMSVAIRVQPAFAFGSPVTLPIMGFVQDPGNTPRLYDITKDGKQFIMLFRAGQTTRGITSTQIQVVLNWFSELQQRVPTSN